MANFKLIMLPIFLILCFLFPPQTTCFNNETDLHSLLAFKSCLKDPLGALNSWNQTLHFCRWNGIQCGRRHRDRVIEINLKSQGLVGSLSPHVGNLSFLRTIILQNNTIHGQIPQEIGLLRRLEFINVSANSFIGAIPKNLSRCPNLFYLDLIDNNLSATVPTELGSLSKLQFLCLSINKLSGHIPPSIGNLTSLTQLSLAECGLTGEIPESLAQLRSLHFLGLGDNSLTGTIPSGIFNITPMEWFEVAANKLEGVIPSTIGLTLPNLKRLYLRENQFSGPIPASISNASLLELIIFSRNHFTGPFPRLGRLTHLQYFTFGINLIEDDISFISSLTNSTELQVIEVSDNQLTGSLPDSIANLTIYLLGISENRIHGNIPSDIGSLTNLTGLALYHNYLEGPIPMGIAKLSNLHVLYLDGNRLTYELPSSLGNLTFLIRLYLNDNNFLGNLPSGIGNFTDLLEFDLAHNNFSGVIPPQIMNISAVSIIFNLSYNHLKGSIPSEVGSLTSLTALDLSSNRLSGQIPNTLARCTSLQQLYLQGNLLEGEIPKELGALVGLLNLDLSRNNLSGEIPSFLGKLNLENLNLSFNMLQGEVPRVGVFRNTKAISLDGNKQLCGGILKLRLPPCSPVKPQKKNLSSLKTILIPIVATGGTCLLMLFALFTYKQRISQRNVTPFVSSFTSVEFMRLSYADLLKATDGFSETNLLGVGRFGSVYKGILNDGQTMVAVKVLNLFVRGASRSFMAECNVVRDIRHRNLLKILSVCESIDFQGNDFKALIYEFKANGSLEKWLYHSREQEGEQNAETNHLNIIQRLNIAIDIAQAIEYLHFGTDLSIVHGDLKPSNILLDHEMTACVGDFGLAKIISNIVPSHESNSSIGIRGTLGYVPPEYGTSCLVSMQGDAYSYGIILLEMFTNKRPIDDLFMDRVNLHNFVNSALPDQVMEIVDPQFQVGPNMNNDKIRDCVASILSIGVSCSKEMPRDRMSIKDVVNELHKIQKLLSRLKNRVED